MRILKAAVFASAIASSSFAQQQPPPVLETIEVRVANIDVVVRDKAGNPVSGLTKDDFELYDDKTLQKITNFYEVRRGEATGPAGATAADAEIPVEVRQRRVVIFVDAATLTPSRKTVIVDSVRRFMNTSLRPEDRVMLVAWRLGLNVITPFTNNREALNHGLETIIKMGPNGEGSGSALSTIRRNIDRLAQTADSENSQPAAGGSAVPRLPLITWDDAYSEARTIVSNYAQQLEHQQEELSEAIRHVATSMAGLDGKRVLVFVGETFAEHPGADLARYVNTLFGPHLDRNNLPELDTVSGFMGSTMPATIDQLGKDVAANGVAIYAIGAAPTDSDISSENSSVVDQGYTFSRDANTARTLQQLATLTGGVALSRTSNFDLAFDTINRDLSSYYSLGYKPLGEGARQHKILVKVKNPAYVVRARQTFVTKSTDDQMEDRTIANLYVDPAKNEWPISIRVGHPEADEGKFKVPLVIEMPSTVTLLPEGDKLSGSFSVYLVAGTAGGGISPVLRRPQNFSIPKDAEEGLRAQPMTFSTAVRVNPGESVVSVAIIDHLSGAMGFARTTIVAK